VPDPAQILELAAEMRSRATSEGIAQALELVASVRRNAVDAVDSGRETDLPELLSKVCPTTQHMRVLRDI
jgi:hypothetical protein